MRMWVQSLASLSGLRIGCCRQPGIGHRCGSDPELLWPWRRLADAASIGPLAWELPHAASRALQKTKKRKEKKRNKRKKPEKES